MSDQPSSETPDLVSDSPPKGDEIIHAVESTSSVADEHALVSKLHDSSIDDSGPTCVNVSEFEHKNDDSKAHNESPSEKNGAEEQVKEDDRVEISITQNHDDNNHETKNHNDSNIENDENEAKSEGIKDDENETSTKLTSDDNDDKNNNNDKDDNNDKNDNNDKDDNDKDDNKDDKDDKDDNNDRDDNKESRPHYEDEVGAHTYREDLIDDDDDDVIKTGWLRKKGAINRKFKQRYFVLRVDGRAVLQYFHTDTTTLRGSIDLRKVTAVRERTVKKARGGESKSDTNLNNKKNKSNAKSSTSNEGGDSDGDESNQHVKDDSTNQLDSNAEHSNNDQSTHDGVPDESTSTPTSTSTSTSESTTSTSTSSLESLTKITDNYFEVVTFWRTYLLVADTPDEQRQWVSILNEWIGANGATKARTRRDEIKTDINTTTDEQKTTTEKDESSASKENQ